MLENDWKTVYTAMLKERMKYCCKREQIQNLWRGFKKQEADVDKVPL